MFNSGILDVVLGLIFIYLLFSLVCTAINEWIESFLKKRSTTLEQGIRELLDDKSQAKKSPDGKLLDDSTVMENIKNGLAYRVYTHPLIYSLYRGEYDQKKKKLLPSYIPARNFAIALTDIVLKECDDPSNPVKAFEMGLEKLPNGKARDALLVLTRQAGGDIDKTRKSIEEWYDSSMDRVSGWYKRHVQRITLGVALLIAVAINVDTIYIASRLSYDVAMRESLVAAAQSYANKSNSSTGQLPSTQADYALVAQDQGCTSPECQISQNLNEVAKLGLLGLPIGWNLHDLPVGPVAWMTRIVGWILTAFAVSLGAPFWFDILNKVMVVRSTVRPKEKSPEEPPVDRENKLVLSIDKGDSK